MNARLLAVFLTALAGALREAGAIPDESPPRTPLPELVRQQIEDYLFRRGLTLSPEDWQELNEFLQLFEDVLNDP